MNDLFSLGQSQAGFQEWFTFDFRLAVGRTPVELFLERHGARLRSGVRRYLERMRRTHLRPYEIIAVRLDEGLDLLDLWAKKRISVRECLATREVVLWDVLAARVVLGPGGAPVMDGLPYRYPPSAKESVMKAVRRSLRAIARRFPDDDETMRFKRMGALFHVLWLDEVALRPRPALVTPEGDALIFAKVGGAGARPAGVADERRIRVGPEEGGGESPATWGIVPGGDHRVRQPLGADLRRRGSPGRRQRMSGKITKRASRRKGPAPPDDMRREYRLDYRKARPNKFAAILKSQTAAVVLDPDVASVFESSESVNRLLRSVIAALPAHLKADRRRG